MLGGLAPAAATPPGAAGPVHTHHSHEAFSHPDLIGKASDRINQNIYHSCSRSSKVPVTKCNS